MHILLGTNIVNSDLHVAQDMLEVFYNTAGKLYSETIFTANVHLLVHIAPMVRLWGPLWAYSVFPFENMNGKIGQAFHGTSKIVAFQLQLMQSIPHKLVTALANESPSTKCLIEKSKHDNMQQIGNHIYSVGALSVCLLSEHA